MADVEKVISVLLDEKNWETLTGIDGVPSFAMDAVVLLKSQQAEIDCLLVELASAKEEVEGFAELLKPKEGHWEVFTMCANEGTYCSECHTKIFDFVTPPKRKLSMFCPHCGAKMSEERISR